MSDLRAAAQQEQSCNCRWDGDVQVQQCTLHEAHVDAVHEWAERAKAAEAKLVALAQDVPKTNCGKSQEQAWREHVEQRIRSWRQRTMNKSGDRLSLDDFMGQESIEDLIDFVCDEYLGPDSAESMVVACDCETATSPDGTRLTRCGSDQMRRAVAEGHAFVKLTPDAAAITSLRAALAQQEQEPVAWLTPRTRDSYARPDLGYETASEADYGAFPVYAHPAPQRQPLTVPQIHELDWPEGVAFEDVLAFARAIERAHGIE